MSATLKRHPNVPFRRVGLDEPLHERQIRKGLFLTERGERFALPMDRIADPTTFLDRKLWRRDRHGRVFRPGVKFEPFRTAFQRKGLIWLRDNVNENIPLWYYTAMLGHDLHVSTWGELYGKHWHRGWANPFTGETEAPLDPTFETLFKTHPELEHLRPAFERLGGFTEDLGLLSRGKVTDAFVSNEIDNLVGTNAEYPDYDYHEVGTDNTAENNDHTALQATSGIARATGTPTDSDPIYQNVGTVTADASETWEEHGLFNNTTGATLMDRSLTGGQAVVSSDQVQYTYQLTKNPEA